MSCSHENFSANVEINRMLDTGAFLANVTVQCSDCCERFVFVGLPQGMSYNEAMMSPFGHEARLPIKPASVEWKHINSPEFRIRGI